MISSPRIAVSRQAGEAVGRTTIVVKGAGGGWVADALVAGALAGSPPTRADKVGHVHRA